MREAKEAVRIRGTETRWRDLEEVEKERRDKGTKRKQVRGEREVRGVCGWKKDRWKSEERGKT